ncbi:MULTISPECIES: HAAS signaling domain-containing protein [Staphylococcus]|uniref:HAAS signaling domain-containing protein n=1 Tax=Staphylococcus TaxID=1279 RepID=UPI000DF825B7|nr:MULTISPECIES: DUF1700 domain-containing protein [unclassified Staphylococcus]UXV35864.1 DUF1700 domain-containing protein [Staphylococcus sp. IVB6181]
MNKITFLNDLESELRWLPRHEQDKIMYEYEDIFYEGEREGRSEVEILKGMESPKKIAKEIYAQKAIKNAEYAPNAQNVTKAVLATLGIGILTLVIILIPLLFVVMFMVILLLASLVLLLSPVIMLSANILSGFTHFIFSDFLFAFGYSGLGIIFIVLIFKLAEVIYKLILKYLRWNLKLIRGSINS